MRQEPTFPRPPKQKPDEDDEQYARRLARWMLGEDDPPLRSKGDLREWTGSPPFHLNKEPT